MGFSVKVNERFSTENGKKKYYHDEKYKFVVIYCVYTNKHIYNSITKQLYIIICYLTIKIIINSSLVSFQADCPYNISIINTI